MVAIQNHLTNETLTIMELITPDFGYFFWMVIAFGIVFFCLAKFAFPVIGKALKTREQKISEALEQAERTHEEMKNLQAKNEEMLKQAREERENMLNEARQYRDKIIEEETQTYIYGNVSYNEMVKNMENRIGIALNE